MEFRTVPLGSWEYEQAVELRRTVLRLPLGLDFSAAELQNEDGETHLVGVEEGRVVAVALLQPAGGAAKMRQVAVIPELQGKGTGTRLVEAFEALARSQGYRDIVLHARELAVKFYERLEYVVEGEPFEEVTIAHRKMRKVIG